MQIIHFGDREVRVQGSPWALFLYDQEFSTETTCFFSDLERSADPVFLLKCAWAMAKCYADSIKDPLFPPFKEWMQSLDISMQANAPWTQEVVSALNAEVFRSNNHSGEESE